jgi:DNA-binding GntR family transcriptional regulator
MRVSLPHRTLSAAITDRLRTAILDGEHAAGAQLRQDALAEAFGVSRIPVREALFQLEAEGLVQMVPHKGALVTGLSMEEVDDVFDLRIMLEPRLLRNAIPQLTDAGFARIEAAQRAFDATIKSGEIAGSGALNAEFHMALYAAARLPKTASIVASLLQTSERYTRLQLSSSRAFAKAGREHRELLAACRAGDVRSAGDVLAAHIEGVRADLAAVLRRTSGIAASVDRPVAIRTHEKPAPALGRTPRSRTS